MVRFETPDPLPAQITAAIESASKLPMEEMSVKSLYHLKGCLVCFFIVRINFAVNSTRYIEQRSYAIEERLCLIFSFPIIRSADIHCA
jgi:hypothetical protein